MSMTSNGVGMKGSKPVHVRNIKTTSKIGAQVGAGGRKTHVREHPPKGKDRL